MLKIKFHIVSIIKIMMLKLIYGKQIKIGKNVTFRRRFSVFIDKGGFLEIGDNVFFNNDCSINVMEKVSIGNDCIFGEGVKIYDHNHRFRNALEPIKNQGFKTGEIRIGENCWIGSNCIILRKSDLGNSCVIGASAVIEKKIKNNMIIIPNRDYELLMLQKDKNDQ